MLYKPLTIEETNQVETIIKNILDSRDITRLFEGKMLIKIKRRRIDVYLILKEDLSLFNDLSSKLPEKSYDIIHIRVKLGFFIRNKFLIGIESLDFLAPLTKKRIELDALKTKQFIYGNDIDLDNYLIQKQIGSFKENDVIMVFSPNNIPIGYARLVSLEKKIWLQNLVDIGIFLRSEKISF